MTLTKEEQEGFIKSILRAQIDLGQAGNYALDSKYEEARENIKSVLDELGNIISKFS